MRAALVLITAALIATAFAAGTPCSAPAAATTGPRASALKATEITSDSAALTVTIKPHAARTTYEMWLQWLPECSRHGCEEVDTRLIAEGTIDASKDSKALIIRTRLALPKWGYSAWLLATNEHGEALRATHFRST